MNKHLSFFLLGLGCVFCYWNCSSPDESQIQLHRGDQLVMVGGNLGARMINFGHLETELQLRYPEMNLSIRNMCDGGNTPGFWPHSARNEPWSFPGAEIYQDELARNSGSKGFYGDPDSWLYEYQADIILGFFGYNESFAGADGLENFKAELNAYVHHLQSKQYNGVSSPTIALISPISFEDLSETYDLPNGDQENQNLEIYTNAIKEVAEKNKLPFVDVFSSSIIWYDQYENYLTIDGFQLTDSGYQLLAKEITNQLFGNKEPVEKRRKTVHESVMEKNWMWHNDYKIPNGVHVYGRRFEPFGPDNYPDELIKIRELTLIRDSVIWAVAQGGSYNLEQADQNTHTLPPVKTNYGTPDDDSQMQSYLYGQDAIDAFTMAPGYEIALFASEKEFPNLANPCQLSFDNRGRLWVATMPTYPHYRPGDRKPDDKLLIYEDANNDGKADKEIIFADGLHLPTGFEITHEGVYVAQTTNLILLTDTDGDDRADEKKIVLSGFDDHDTHHVISAFCADPSGAIYMGEGVFLHTNVETPYGTVRGTNGGFYRYNPQRKMLERTAQISIPNPWGIAFDTWGQPFFCETSNPDVRWMLPGTIKSLYAVFNPKGFNIIENAHRVRPTSGIEFVSSRHFPDEVQGDLLINNTIGFLGTKQHRMIEEGTGYSSRHRLDLVQSSDPNFRPVDMEFAPDGSLYLVDWHNKLIGHMQHNARDPLRDHQHGRIYRITYPDRSLVQPALIAGASIEQLLDNLKEEEYRTRYRTRRELRKFAAQEIQFAIKGWISALDPESKNYEHHLVEALWVLWGANTVDTQLLNKILNSPNPQVRAAGVRVIRYMHHQIDNYLSLLETAAEDPHGRVRMEAIVAASWLPKAEGLGILAKAKAQELDKWIRPTLEAAEAHLNGRSLDDIAEEKTEAQLPEKDLANFQKGKAIFSEEGSCMTCHQADGKGLDPSGFPPLANTRWVNGDPERLIKIVLNGVYGPMEVLGKTYPGQVPMTPFGRMLEDEEIAAVLTYVKNAFGNQSGIITADQVKKVRQDTKNKEGFYTAEELLKEHPIENEL